MHTELEWYLCVVYVDVGTNTTKGRCFLIQDTFLQVFLLLFSRVITGVQVVIVYRNVNNDYVIRLRNDITVFLSGFLFRSYSDVGYLALRSISRLWRRSALLLLPLSCGKSATSASADVSIVCQ